MHLFSPWIGSWQVLSHPVREDLKVIPKTAALGAHYKMQFNIISMTLNCFKYCSLILIILCPVSRPVEYTDCFFAEGLDPHQWESWIWHSTIWCWDSSNAWALWNGEYPLIAIASGSTLAMSGSTWYGPIYRSIELNCFDIQMCTCAKLNCLKENCFDI